MSPDLQSLSIFNLLRSPVWIYSIQRHRMVWANPPALGLWETDSLDELLSRDFADGMADAVKVLLESYMADFRLGRSFSEWWSFSPKGIRKQVYAHLSGIKIGNELMMLVEAVIDSESLLHEVAISRTDTIAALFDGNGGLLNSNRYFQEVFGAEIKKLQQIYGEACPGFFIQLHKTGSYFCEGESTTLQGQRWFQFQFRYFHARKQILLTIYDITDRKLEELEQRHLATHDSMTGLLNRYGVMQAIDAHCDAGERFALLFMDLDHFKLVNDNLGHRAGDCLLVTMADRLRHICPQDILLARLGGDEFTALIPLHEGDSHRAELFAQKVLTQFSEPFLLRGLPEVRITGSIGIAIHPDDADNADALLSSADVAMYQAKRMGRSTWQRFTCDMQHEVQRKLTVSQLLSKAIERNELSLVYQPKGDLQRGVIDCCEALLRWKSDELGMVSPAEFIPLAEETGLIRDLGAWVIRTALAQMADWRNRFGKTIPLAINLSGMQITPELPDWIASELARHNLAPNLLTIELTETVLMLDVEGCRQVLEALSKLGVHISIDDFGTGYSSLAYLNRLPIHEIKLDRSFVAGKNLPVIRATVAMVSSFGMSLIAEGVETEEELSILKAEGCAHVQGYLISRPLSVKEFEDAHFIIHTPIGDFPFANSEA